MLSIDNKSADSSCSHALEGDLPRQEKDAPELWRDRPPSRAELPQDGGPA